MRKSHKYRGLERKIEEMILSGQELQDIKRELVRKGYSEVLVRRGIESIVIRKECNAHPCATNP